MICRLMAIVSCAVMIISPTRKKMLEAPPRDVLAVLTS
jgi:hypothetical protein